MSALTRRRFLRRTGLAAGALLVARGASRGGPPPASTAPLAKLETEIDGHLVLPSSPTYGELRRTASFNPTTDAHPVAIVLCSSARDVARALGFARDQGLAVAVRGGGHDVLGASTCDGGLLIDLGTMKAIAVDPEARSARCAPGLRAGEVNDALQPFGLAAALGCNPVVGIGGLALGGGIGWLAGKYGATCDSLLRAEVVTADGRIVHASREENPDLFWALRGGGGNFGIVISFELRVHPLTRVLGGIHAYPLSRLSEVLRVYREVCSTSADELTVEISIQCLAEPLVLVMVCHAGDPPAGERALEPLRALEPVASTVRIVEHARLTDRPGLGFALRALGVRGTLETVSRSLDGPAPYGIWRGTSLPDLGDPVLDDLVAAIDGAPAEWRVGIGHYMHGAICRPDEDTPLVRRPGTFACFFGVNWREERDAAGAMTWVEAAWRRLARHAPATYVNYLSDDSPAAVRAAYGPHYARLAGLKRAYDPNNVFRGNRNIAPSA